MIGEQIVFKEDVKINATISEKVMTIHKGDKGIVDSKGFVHVTTGKCRGKILKIDDAKIKGYDLENIANMLVSRVKYLVDDLEEILDSQGVGTEALQIELIDALETILR